MFIKLGIYNVFFYFIGLYPSHIDIETLIVGSVNRIVYLEFEIFSLLQFVSNQDFKYIK